MERPVGGEIAHDIPRLDRSCDLARLRFQLSDIVQARLRKLDERKRFELHADLEHVPQLVQGRGDNTKSTIAPRPERPIRRQLEKGLPDQCGSG